MSDRFILDDSLGTITHGTAVVIDNADASTSPIVIPAITGTRRYVRVVNTDATIAIAIHLAATLAVGDEDKGIILAAGESWELPANVHYNGAISARSTDGTDRSLAFIQAVGA